MAGRPALQRRLYAAMLPGGATRDAASWDGRSPPPLLGASSWDGGGAAGAPQWCRADHHVCPLSLHPVWLNWRVRVSGAKDICLDGRRQHSGASAETAERPTQAGVRLRIGLLALLPAPLLSLGSWATVFTHGAYCWEQVGQVQMYCWALPAAALGSNRLAWLAADLGRGTDCS